MFLSSWNKRMTTNPYAYIALPQISAHAQNLRLHTIDPTPYAEVPLWNKLFWTIYRRPFPNTLGICMMFSLFHVFIWTHKKEKRRLSKQLLCSSPQPDQFPAKSIWLWIAPPTLHRSASWGHCWRAQTLSFLNLCSNLKMVLTAARASEVVKNEGQTLARSSHGCCRTSKLTGLMYMIMKADSILEEGHQKLLDWVLACISGHNCLPRFHPKGLSRIHKQAHGWTPGNVSCAASTCFLVARTWLVR